MVNAEERQQALTVPCKYCGAHIGQECRNTKTAQPLQYAAAHISRLIDAIEIPF